MQAFRLITQPLPSHTMPPSQPPLSLGVRVAGFYFILIFVFWPLLVNYFPEGSVVSRFPLLVGIIMIAIALHAGRKVTQILMVAQWFFAFGFFFFLSSTYGSQSPGLVEAITLLVRNVGLGLVLVLTIRTPAELNFFLKIMLWSGVASACYGMFFMVPGLTAIGGLLVSLGFPSGKNWLDPRMIGLQTDPTYFGLFLTPGFLIALDQVLRARVKQQVEQMSRGLSMGVMLLLALGVLLSFSRTTWAGAAAGVLILIGLQGHLFRSVFFFVIFVTFLQIAAPDNFLAATISENSARTSLVMENQADSRSWIWKSYFELAMKKPFGYGMGSVEDLRMLATWTYARADSPDKPRPHNMYLLLWVESGLQTLVPLLGLIFISVVRSWRVRNYQDPATGISYGILSMALIVSIAVGLFALGGMMQLLSIVVAFGLVSWYMATEGKLVYVP